jgi:hypothetical protein
MGKLPAQIALRLRGNRAPAARPAFFRGGTPLRMKWKHGFALVSAMTLLTGTWASDEAMNIRDTLVYQDGLRIQGKLVNDTDGVLVFRSDRFGELRVLKINVVVIEATRFSTEQRSTKLDAPPPRPAATATMTGAARAAPVLGKTPQSPSVGKKDGTKAEGAARWQRVSLSELTAHVRNFFWPWHGRLAFSAENVSDVADQSNYALEGNLKRKREYDEVQLNARYDFARTNEVPTSDVLKASGSWRHELNKKRFVHYRPSIEWNRASKRQGLPSDYVLLLQEIGVGHNLYATEARKVRLGVSQNFFDTWSIAPLAEHTRRSVPSAFEEIELKLPWQMGLSQRAVCYPVGRQRDGWEGRIELIKKLTETLSTSLRHEIRSNNPDGIAQDYRRLKLLVGLDF